MVRCGFPTALRTQACSGIYGHVVLDDQTISNLCRERPTYMRQAQGGRGYFTLEGSHRGSVSARYPEAAVDGEWVKGRFSRRSLVFGELSCTVFIECRERVFIRNVMRI